MADSADNDGYKSAYTHKAGIDVVRTGGLALGGEHHSSVVI